MRIIKKALLFLISILSVGCGTKVYTSSVAQSSPSYGKYTKAQRYYDYFYENEGIAPFEKLTTDVLPEVTFSRDPKNKTTVHVEGYEILQRMHSIYLADANLDGFLDIGFHTSTSHSSSLNCERVVIFDWHNKNVIFETSSEENHVLDLDDDGNLILEELEAENGGGTLQKLRRAGRFLNNQKPAFEWFNFERRIKSLYLDGPTMGTDGLTASIGQKCTVFLYLIGVGSNKPEDALPIVSIVVNSNAADFSYKVEKGIKASNYNLECAFGSEGHYTLTVVVEGVSLTTQVKVI